MPIHQQTLSTFLHDHPNRHAQTFHQCFLLEMFSEEKDALRAAPQTAEVFNREAVWHASGAEIQSRKLLHLMEPDYNFILDTLLEIDREFEIRLSGKRTYLNAIFSASHRSKLELE